MARLRPEAPSWHRRPQGWTCFQKHQTFWGIFVIIWILFRILKNSGSLNQFFKIPAWLNGRPKDIIYMYYSIRRYWIAWLYKYSRPGMKPLEAQTVGQYGYPGNFNLSGSGIAQVDYCFCYLKKNYFFDKFTIVNFCFRPFSERPFFSSLSSARMRTTTIVSRSTTITLLLKLWWPTSHSITKPKTLALDPSPSS